MPDVKLTCAKCGKVVVVSEFVDMSAVRCKCGEILERPADFEAQRPKKPVLTLKSDEAIAASVGAQDNAQEWHFSKTTAKKEEVEKFQLTHTKIATVIFAVFAPAYAYCRFGDSMPPDVLTMLIAAAPFIFGAIYLVIVLSAFKDTIFQGLLCLLPFYPFYYVFMISDDFYLRAVAGIMLAGAGYDSILVLNDWTQNGIIRIQQYIASGG